MLETAIAVLTYYGAAYGILTTELMYFPTMWLNTVYLLLYQVLAQSVVLTYQAQYELRTMWYLPTKCKKFFGYGAFETCFINRLKKRIVKKKENKEYVPRTFNPDEQ